MRDAFDAVAIHLCIQIINRCKEQMAIRKIAVLNAHFDKVRVSRSLSCVPCEADVLADARLLLDAT